MTFRDGLIKARSHIIFVVGLLTALPLILWLDRADSGASPAPPSADATDRLIADGPRLPIAAPAPLRPDQIEWGRIAWQYFERNIDPDTGLANSADQYPSTTMWDTGSFLLGLVAAHRIGIVDQAAFDARLSRALGSLARLPLFDGALPNKAYQTHTLAMVDYDNRPTASGVGWSALDIARLLVPLIMIRRDYAGHAAEVDRVLAQWKLGRLVRDGRMVGATLASGTTSLHQEGRLGYEEYAAKSLILAGLDAFQAWRTDDSITFEQVQGVAVPVDSRSPSQYDAQVYTTSEPYMLDGLEFGFDTRSRAFAEQVYRAQMARFSQTGIVTAVSEGHLDQAPSFAYDTVYGNGAPWAVLTDKGDRIDRLRIFSTKTAFAWDAIFGGDYGARLIQSAVALNDPKGGWIEGRYETDGRPNGVETANTNGVLLESLHFRCCGPLLGRVVQ